MASFTDPWTGPWTDRWTAHSFSYFVHDVFESCIFVCRVYHIVLCFERISDLGRNVHAVSIVQLALCNRHGFVFASFFNFSSFSYFVHDVFERCIFVCCVYRIVLCFERISDLGRNVHAVSIVQLALCNRHGFVFASFFNFSSIFFLELMQPLSPPETTPISREIFSTALFSKNSNQKS